MFDARFNLPAEPFVPMRWDLEDDPAVVTIAVKLRVDTGAVVIACFRLWRWAMKTSADGNMGATPEAVDHRLGLPGFAQAYIDVGWGSLRDGAFVIENFDRWLSKGAVRRIRNAAHQRNARYSGVDSPPCQQGVSKASAPPLTRRSRRADKRSQKSEDPSDLASQDPSEAAKSRGSAKPDGEVRTAKRPWWEAVCSVWSDKLAPVTDSDKTRIGRLARDYAAKAEAEGCREAPEDTLRAKRLAYQRTHPEWDCTPEAVLKHWTELRAAPAARMKAGVF